MKIVLKETQFNILLEKYKIGDEERVKLMETDDFLLVVPLTHNATCKYGAKTKWCVTEKDPDMFERHYDMGSLGILIVKNPEVIETLGNEKFAFYVNRPTSIENARNIEKILVYDDSDHFIPSRSFLNFADNLGYLPQIQQAMKIFITYADKKFNPENSEMIKRGLRNPF